jgi:hypothetical protein
MYSISSCGYFEKRSGKQMEEFPFSNYGNFFHQLGEYISSPMSSRYILGSSQWIIRKYSPGKCTRVCVLVSMFIIKIWHLPK